MATYEDITQSAQNVSAVDRSATLSEWSSAQRKTKMYFMASVSPRPPDIVAAQEPDGLTIVSSNLLTVQELPRLPSVLKVGELPKQDAYVLLQKWEGVVKKIENESFLAELKDLTDEGPEEEAEFPIDDIPNSDKELVAPGAVFYWCIGYLDTLNGQRVRASEIRFRRLPTWTDREVERAKSEAEQIRDVIGWK